MVNVIREKDETTDHFYVGMFQLVSEEEAAEIMIQYFHERLDEDPRVMRAQVALDQLDSERKGFHSSGMEEEFERADAIFLDAIQTLYDFKQILMRENENA